MDISRFSYVLFLVLFFIIFNPFFGFSQTDSTISVFKSTPLSIKDPIFNLRMGGYFRFLGYVRNFQEMYALDVPNYYSGEYPQPTTIGVGTGYREPMMMLSISGKANKNVNFGTDLMLNSPFNGSYDNNSIAMYLGSNVYSTIDSEIGKFGVHAGGIKWYRQSKLTAWAEEGYLRYSLFERAPYDPLTKEVSQRYSDYYAKGSISQDLRFGNVAFQGITFSGNSFPWWFTDGVSFQGILGKTQNNIANIVAPGKDDYCFGLRLNKTSLKRNSFSLKKKTFKNLRNKIITKLNKNNFTKNLFYNLADKGLEF